MNSPSARPSLSARLVLFFERTMPDPFVLAVGLTALVALAAACLAPQASPAVMLKSWYDGVFAIFGFAFQMIMILVTGHALAHAPPVRRGLEKLVSLARTPSQGMLLAFFVSAAASWLNWGFGLVIGAMVAREVARRIRVDFAWVVGAAYGAWMIWSVGPSGSIPLIQASHGNALNLVEKFTGRVLPFSETLFTSFTVIPTLAVLVLLPLVFLKVRPAEKDSLFLDPVPSPPPAPLGAATPGQRLERSPVINLFLVAAGVAYLVLAARNGTLQFDVNMVIFLFLIAGLLLHASPVAYASAVRNAAAHSGSMMLQYPIYGGIMGMMVATGLAQRISEAIVSDATAHTLPFLSFLGSLLITLVIPSGGGHWAVQGPFTVPAALHLHASVAATAMGVAFGEQVANMIQPFWVLPMVAIAGTQIHRVMGFTVLAFLVGTLAYGASLLLLV